ncbi:MAG: adenine nucleotide alpha hydrolase [Planctomycetes bacterium]|nr:adenine nucleotide alpha hydrolase [Planctomycetota bacterium]
MNTPLPPAKPKALVSWSGGKDCLLALWHARAAFDVTALLTTVTAEFGRISIHGVRVELLHLQAASLGIPVRIVEIPYPCPNAIYESVMRDAWRQAQSEGIHHAICGDLFLEDVRRYREERLFGNNACVFPLWQRPPLDVAHEFLTLGFRAVLCCVDTQTLPAEFAGRPYDDALLRDLPAGVDPCGENGEFHTFVHAGPVFRTPIQFEYGARVLREGRFAYCDLVATVD